MDTDQYRRITNTESAIHRHILYTRAAKLVAQQNAFFFLKNCVMLKDAYAGYSEVKEKGNALISFEPGEYTK